MSLEKTIADNGWAVLEKVIDLRKAARIVDAITNISNDPHGVRHLQNRCDAVRDLCRDEAVLELARTVIGCKAFAVRALFFDKNEKANWKVAWHQDLTIAVRERIDTLGFTAWSIKDNVVHAQPPIIILERMVTVRVHLDDCMADNGPLRVLSGSHRNGRLDAAQIAHWRQTVKEDVCLVQRGGALVMKPLILHASSQAAEPTHRRVVHLEFAGEDLPNGLRWANQ